MGSVENRKYYRACRKWVTPQRDVIVASVGYPQWDDIRHALYLKDDSLSVRHGFLISHAGHTRRPNDLVYLFMNTLTYIRVVQQVNYSPTQRIGCGFCTRCEEVSNDETKLGVWKRLSVALESKAADVKKLRTRSAFIWKISIEKDNCVHEYDKHKYMGYNWVFYGRTDIFRSFAQNIKRRYHWAWYHYSDVTWHHYVSNHWQIDSLCSGYIRSKTTQPILRAIGP